MALKPGYNVEGGTPAPLRQEIGGDWETQPICLDHRGALDPVKYPGLDTGTYPPGTYLAKDSDYTCYVPLDSARIGVQQDPETVVISPEALEGVDDGGLQSEGIVEGLWSDRVFYNGLTLTPANKARFEQRLRVWTTDPD